MSNLRKIMQRLARNQAEVPKPSHQSADAMDQRMRWHLEAYQQRIEACTPPMLQYEWMWLEDHLATLELCSREPEMLSAAGGTARVLELLLEHRQYQNALAAMMTVRGVEPARHSHPLVEGEHAWEVRQDTIKRLWGWH